MSHLTHPNDLQLYRERLRFSRKHVARLLQHRTSSGVSRLELGRRLPPLMTALRLAAIYRVPVEFLYPQMYSEIRDSVRGLELESKSTVHSAQSLTNHTHVRP
jgi:transcriptional regulator with XRE-family HTH domain